MKLASKASALTVTSPGAMDSIPTLKEVLEHQWEEEKECTAPKGISRVALFRIQGSDHGLGALGWQ